MPGVVIHYLLVYSLTHKCLEVCQEYTDAAEALDAYGALEAKYRDRYDEFEVVLLGADSKETLLQTHAHYFALESEETTSLFSSLLPS